MRRRWPRLLLAVLIALLIARTAEARLGGGGGFSGGGSSSSGGGGGGGDIIFDCLFQLLGDILCQLFEAYPVPCSILLVIAIAGYFIMNAMGAFDHLNTRAPSTAVTASAVTENRRRSGLATLVEADPNFSTPVFLDFAVLLYSRVIDASAKGAFAKVRPYVAESAFSHLPAAGGALSEVCVGAATILDAETTPAVLRITVKLEASMIETAADGTRRSLRSEEVWRFMKQRGVLSASPDDEIDFACPSCGDPGEVKPDGVCASCGKVVTDGRYSWSVDEISAIRRPQTADNLDSGMGDAPEPPTWVAPDLPRERRAFEARYPGFSLPEFLAYVERAFVALQDAWTTRRFEKARPWETDAIFQTHRFWIEAYKRFQRTNVLEQVTVRNVVLAKIERDAFYDAITVRIFFSMVDYTKSDTSGEVLSGDATRPRKATEYWTFIRRSGFEGAKTPGDPGEKCPSCGAPVQISMTGVCERCSRKVTSGQFGWVLSRIDQDSVYNG